MTISRFEFPISALDPRHPQAGSLNICTQEIELAGQVFNQFWLPKPGLFGTRNMRSSNHTVVLDFYRALCLDRVKGRDSNSDKVHLLASLLPKIRSNGAQAIFPDASVKPPRGVANGGVDVEALESQLRGSKDEQLSLVDFCNRNRDAVGFPNFPEDTFSMYRKFEQRLFEGTAKLWWENENVANNLVEKRWLDWCNGFGRRRGNKVKKDVLNILSYESKAAFHQCYSALWVEMLPRLMTDQANREFSQRFHTLWHLDHRLKVPGQDRDAHLFQGLALGLHPAFGNLLQTETGRRLTGETVLNPNDIAGQERFLHAGLVSLYLYAAARLDRMT